MKKISKILLLLMVFNMLFACAKEIEKPKEVETTMKEETIQVAEVKKEEVDINGIITEALLNHYDEMFGKTNAMYKTTGYKVYEINNAENGEKKVFILANYMEYNLDGENPVNTAGSGPAGIALTISSDGKTAKVDYEVLTDGDYESEEFKKLFPKSVQEKLNPMSESDRKEVIKKQEEMLSRLIKGE